jgi:hypothetical protein
MRCIRACLALAPVPLVVGLLAPAARAAEPPESHAGTNPGVRAEFRQLLQELDLYLQAKADAPGRRSEKAKASPADQVRRAAQRFANGRLAHMEAQSPLTPEERAEWREVVRRHVTRAAEAGRPLPPPGPRGAAVATAAAKVPDPSVTASTGVLSGRVTRAATGTGISGSAVWLYQGYSYVTSVDTDASGNYSFTGLSTGTYYVKTNNFDGYIDEAWDNVPCDYSCRPVSSGGTPIAVTDGSTTPNIDFALARGGRITGTAVNAATSAPIANLALIFKNSNGPDVTYAYTNAAGVFTSYGGLVSGTYLVRTNTTWTSAGFVDEVYNNISCPLSACSSTTGTPIAVTSPSTTGGINFALDPGGGLAGKVTDAGTSAGVGNVIVWLFSSGGGLFGSQMTDGSGNWATAQNLPPATYLAGTENFAGYVDEVWDDIPCPGGWPGSCGASGLATPIDVVAGATTSGIDFGLDAGGRISGRVTDAATTTGLSWTEVDIYTENGGYGGYGYTDDTGSYTTSTGLPAGRYHARSYSYSGYINEVYEDKPCVGSWYCPLAEGTPINVNPGATTPGIDFALDRGGQIAGLITDASTGSGVSLIEVDVYSASGRYMSYGYSDGTGSYATYVGGLPTGRYYAGTYQYSGGLYVDEAYDNVPCAGCRPEIRGTPIDVSIGATTPAIDFALDKGGSIAGKVTSAVDGTGISGSVYAYTTNGFFVRRATVLAGGNYTLSGLPPGHYVVYTANSKGFINEVYDDRPCVGYDCDVTAGTPVNVTAGSTTTANFVLSAGARISGRVTDQATGSGLSGVTVSILKPPSGSVTSLSTDSLGYFVSTAGSGNGLPTGGYYVLTSNSLGYQDELYDDIPCLGCDVTLGTKVQLTAGKTTSGINFALSQAGTGRIAGTVTRAATGDPLPLLSVQIYDSTGRAVSSLTTSYLGTYQSGALPPGNYYVAASVRSADYRDELYDNVPFCSGCSPLVGTPVTVTAGNTTSGIDIALDTGGRIEGRVTDASTGAPVLVAYVYAFDASGQPERAVPVDAIGNYSVNGLAAGTHYAIADIGWGYVNQLYSGLPCPVCDPTTGTPITVTAGSTTGGVDFAVAGGGRIEGTLTRAADGLPVSGWVTLYDAAGSAVAGSIVDGSGFYRSSRGLPTGTYFALASDLAGAYDTELYNNKSCNSCDPTTGDVITVTSPAATTGIDFSLDTRSLDFYTLDPCRVIDTRDPPSALGGPALAAREDRVLSVFAKCGIPLTAKALSVNITATGSTWQGNLRLHPGDGPVPTASTMNFVAGQTRANNAVVTVSRFGELAVYCAQPPGNTAHFILDVNGYFQ